MRATGHSRCHCAQNTDHLAHNTPFSAFSPRWSVLWAPHRPKRRAHRHQSGGMTPSKPPTRRRHAAKELRMAQNPHHRRYEARRRDWRSSERVEGPGGGAGSRWRGRGRVGPGTVPGTVAGRQARHNSPSTPSPPLNPRQNSPSAAAPPVFPRQNSPSNLKNIRFGVFRARRANFFALTATIGP